MGTPDDLFRFLLKVATDVPTMTRLSSGDPVQVEQAFEGAELSDNQKDAIRNGSEANVRAELTLPAGFVFNQSGFTVFNQSGFVAEAGPTRKSARKSGKASKAAKAAKAGRTSKANKASKASKGSRKVAKKTAKKSKGRKK